MYHPLFYTSIRYDSPAARTAGGVTDITGNGKTQNIHIMEDQYWNNSTTQTEAERQS